MKRSILTISFIALVLPFAGMARADTVELDLGCPTAFDSNLQNWTTNFDLGVTFTEITNVYIDWSGEITVGLAIYYSNPCNQFPLDVAISTYLDMPIDAGTSVWGGKIPIQHLNPLIVNQIITYLDWGRGLAC